ncbi:HpcH/HpaI aldolase/citrate lyase family protein [Actinokineospora cianjurensis]|uniref:Citrate lyase subunit beta/citryl-CoA lyase/(S)-citramalyl-CoA lyase n=1 Tax=Actinokineospora cianjurensis TaxID=585224 RepID=A0A421B0S3_9PSEU|nr:CoA ester lyase [Actinokineospora cianjurensis]RLK58009.1 citrate lyase subunit beta/citryl-CoA lyase/(S)-citramalyl-CoA lyase [Actinokineospora cianjurensis]
MFSRYCRSVLSVPATAPHRFTSCHDAGADMCVVDLEDSVPLNRKEEARQSAAAFFKERSRCGIRVNAVTDPDGLRDLLALPHYPVRPTIVHLPKVESPRDVEIVDQVLGADGDPLELFAVIETPRGVQRLADIATASPNLRGLIFGAADYAAALGIGLDWEPLAAVRAMIVNAARAAGLHAIDSPTFELVDMALVRAESVQARRLGFSGKIALHPRQVPVLTEVFSPDADQLAHAGRVVAAARRSGHGVATVDGRMVGRPFFAESRRLLDEFGSPAAEPPAHQPPLLPHPPGGLR